MTIDRFNDELRDFPIMITNIPNKGRGILAEKAIYAGTVLWREKPVVVVHPEENIIAVIESTVFKLLGMPQEQFEAILGKLCYLYPTNKTNGREQPTKYVNELEASMLHFTVEMLITGNAVVQEKMLNLRKTFGLPTDASNLLLLLVILRLTMTGIYDEQEVEKVGESLAVVVSFFNHSCYPNSTLFFNPCTCEYEIRANVDIKKGEEIFITYIALYQYTNERRLELRENYGFHCLCARCKNDPSCPSKLDLTPPITQTCLTDTQKDDKVDFLEQLYYRTEQQYYREFMSGENNHTKSISMANEWLKQAEGFYAPLHPHVFKMVEFLGRTYCEAGEYKQSLKYFEKAVQIMDMVFPKIWFRKSCSLGCLGNIYRHLGQNEKAREIEEKRRQILLIVRGEEDWDDGSDDICRSISRS